MTDIIFRNQYFPRALVLVCSVVLLTWLSPLSADTPTSIHELKTSANSPNTYEVAGFDPYLVYTRAVGTFTSEPGNIILEIKSPGTTHPQPLVTFDLFWATSNDGFGEAHKMTYSLPNDGKLSSWRLDLSDLARRKNLNIEEIASMRFDPNMEPGVEFQFQLSFENSDSTQDTTLPSLPYLYLNDPNAINPGIKIQALNSIGVLDGQFKVLNGDPFFKFDLGNAGIDLNKTDSLFLNFQPTENPQDFAFFEIFWATEQHGFSEAYKTFFLYPLHSGIKSSTLPSVIPLKKRIQSIEPKAEQLTALRLDLQYPLPHPFSLEIKPTDASTMRNSNTDFSVISLKYTTNATLLNQNTTISYATKSAITDFLKRLVADPVFSIFYFGMQLLLLAAVFLILSKQFGKQH